MSHPEDVGLHRGQQETGLIGELAAGLDDESRFFDGGPRVAARTATTLVTDKGKKAKLIPLPAPTSITHPESPASISCR